METLSVPAAPRVTSTLPLELEREIFQMAASTIPDTPSCLQLLLVAQRVQSWSVLNTVHRVWDTELGRSFVRIEPIIYETLVVTTAISCKGRVTPAGLSRLLAAKPPESDFLRQHVKRLCLTRGVGVADAVRILSACGAVETLACWVNSSPELIPHIIALPLRTLYIGTKMFADLPLKNNWYASLTRLDLILEHRGDLPFLSWAFPRLSHLSFMGRHLDIFWALEAFHLCEKLKILLVFKKWGEDRQSNDAEAINRGGELPWVAVTEESSGAPSHLEEWIDDTRGLPSWWEEAEDQMRIGIHVLRRYNDMIRRGLLSG